MAYIQVVRMFLYTERARDWNLHLYCIFKMPNLFATTGPNTTLKVQGCTCNVLKMIFLNIISPFN